MSAARTYTDAGGEPVTIGRRYWLRYGPLQKKSESYTVIVATAIAIEPGHRRGGPIQVAYRTPGLLAANRTGWRRPEQLYRHRLAAAFVEMPAEEPVEW